MRSFAVLLLMSIALCCGMAFSGPSAAMATNEVPSQSDKKVYIVHLQRPSTDLPADAQAKHVELLSSVVGSEEAAKGAILYSYKHGVYGFSAKLSPAEVAALSGKPGVLAIVPSGISQLHGK